MHLSRATEANVADDRDVGNLERIAASAFEEEGVVLGPAEVEHGMGELTAAQAQREYRQ